MNKLPIVVFISGNGSNLQEVIDNCHNHTVDIKAVICDQPHAYGLSRAEMADIPTEIVYQHPNQNREQYCEQLIEVTDGYQPRMILLLGFMKILTPNFIQAYPKMIFNLHPSLLPKYPGLNTHQRVYDAKDNLHGISFHMVDEGLDSGPIIFQKAFVTDPHMNVHDLEKRVHEMEHMHVPTAVDILSQYIAAI